MIVIFHDRNLATVKYRSHSYKKIDNQNKGSKSRTLNSEVIKCTSLISQNST